MIVADMKMLALAIGIGALLSLSFSARSAMTSNVAVALVRVPQGGIQPEAAVDSHGTLHLLYFAGEPRGGNLFYVRSTDYGRTFSTADPGEQSGRQRDRDWHNSRRPTRRRPWWACACRLERI